MTPQELDDELDMVRYFWQEKGDVERYVGWPAVREVLLLERPEIVKAWDDYKMAGRMLSAVLGVRP